MEERSTRLIAICALLAALAAGVLVSVIEQRIEAEEGRHTFVGPSGVLFYTNTGEGSAPVGSPESPQLLSPERQNPH